MSLSNFYEVFKLAKMIEIDVWLKWDFLKKCQKIIGTLLELQFYRTSKPILSFRICNFRAIGVTLKILWGLAVGKNDGRDFFEKFQMIKGRLLGLNF